MTILSESFYPETYEELINRNPDIKFNSSEENISGLFISGVTSSHDLSVLTVSIFLSTVYCCKDGEIEIFLCLELYLDFILTY